ncbi:Membrane protein [Streptomyces ambofaciens ATCC 23877]|uniref:Membrane protein n=1 Tax=Streptomyces ambofaciens (strain ATCC 23877 / 3486 / DSM 40053 / JCM 4204 / NBRC 12836 / NRRL B-2516) TaxID=278992 RepID=A0A0K2AS84_STRA7|nr:LCP family protein [Streptomyces ambofaciens]AKZ55677.1 Membrane protein [Streptomyces ambofaciens ATCC 23877]
MNDGYDAGYGGADQYELVGYDEYGRPVYRQAQAPDRSGGQQSYDPYAQAQGGQYAQQQGEQYGQRGEQYPQAQDDPYAQQQVGQYGQQGYGYDPYAAGTQQPGGQPYDPYGSQGGWDTGQQPPTPAPGTYDGYTAGPHGQSPQDPYGRAAATGGRQPRVAEQTAHIPQQAGPREEPETDAFADDAGPDRDYRTEQFAFVEEPTDDSEDVIDWMKFTENRTERREEARRRARARVVALAVVLALVAAGGVGYLWYAGKLPGVSSSDDRTGGTTAAGAQKRDVIAVHLHDTKGGGTSTALLVDNTTTKQGTAVLVPNALALTGDDGTTTTLAASVDDDGPDATRTALDSALGTDIEGTWRLDTPYLQILVDLVGNIEVDTDTDVPDPAAKDKGATPLVHRGEGRTLSGKMAVAYATHRGSGEEANAQLQRFGQVMQGVLRKLSSDPQAATTTIQTLGLILDPPLTDKDLGSFLAGLSDLAKGGDFKTALLPVQGDGRLSAEASDSVVKDVLGGTAKSPDEDAAVSVSVRNATGVEDRTGKARVVLLNGGFTFLEGGTASGTEATSKVVYAKAADKEDAVQVAQTLGLPTGSVTQGEVSANARVSVVLGQDYEPAS